MLVLSSDLRTQGVINMEENEIFMHLCRMSFVIIDLDDSCECQHTTPDRSLLTGNNSDLLNSLRRRLQCRIWTEKVHNVKGITDYAREKGNQPLRMNEVMKNYNLHNHLRLRLNGDGKNEIVSFYGSYVEKVSAFPIAHFFFREVSITLLQWMPRCHHKPSVSSPSILTRGFIIIQKHNFIELQNRTLPTILCINVR